MYNSVAKPLQNPQSMAQGTAPGAQLDVVASQNAKQRAAIRQSSTVPLWVWLVIFGGLYVGFEYFWERVWSKKETQAQFFLDFLVKMLGLFFGVVFVMNLGKIVIGKLILWSQKIPWLHDFLSYVGVVVGNA